MSELAQEAEDPRYPYASTGKKSSADPLRLDKGGGLKGKIHYVAEFIPALALNGVKFEGVQNEVQRAAEAGQGDDDGDVAKDSGSSISSSDEEAQAVPTGITVRQPMGTQTNGHKKGEPSTDTVDTNESVVTAATSKTKETSKTAEEVAQNKGVDLSKDELLKQREFIASTVQSL